MNPAIDQLAKSILHKENLEQCSIEELQHLADQYPYFSAVQLLLAKKMKQENNELYTSQLQKTSLLFYNPLWLEYLMNNTGNAEVVYIETSEHVHTDIHTNPGVDNKIEELRRSDINAINHESFVSSEEKKTEHIQIEEQPENISNVVEASMQEDSNLADNEKENEILRKTNADVTNTDVSSSLEDKESESTNEQLELKDSNGTPIQDEPDIHIELPPFKQQPIDFTKAELTFTPYHTVDYFASLGIKFREEEKPKDKFGQQLKSFTEWLKILKQTPVSEIIKGTDTNIEQKVEQLAGQSLKDNEVVTETMAEVWEKQGNKAKAIDIYNKLSLHDPTKRVYFAAKIEELKKTI